MNVIDVERFGSGARIPIGRQGENLAREIRISTKGFEDAHEGGTAVLLFRRSANEDPYPVPIQAEEGAVTWQPTATDTARAGFGQMEVQWYVGDVLQKSKIYQTYIEKSLEPAGEEPEHPGESWVQQVIEAAQSGADPDTIKGLVEEYLEENPPEAYDDAEVKQDLAQKLTAPATAQVGQFFRVANVDTDGKIMLEAVDAPQAGVQDVTINGVSIVDGDGKAAIPIGAQNVKGVVQPASGGDSVYRSGFTSNYVMKLGDLDTFVVASLADGLASPMTTAQQQAARKRLGIETLTQEEYDLIDNPTGIYIITEENT